jgi:uncharacterized protein YneF (UPF0154 family)
MRFLSLRGLVGAFFGYYIIRKIQIYNQVDISEDGFGLYGAVYYGAFLGYVIAHKYFKMDKKL